jgi:hypothetical protein
VAFSVPALIQGRGDDTTMGEVFETQVVVRVLSGMSALDWQELLWPIISMHQLVGGSINYVNFGPK